MRQLIAVTFILSAAILSAAISDVNVLPMPGPIGTAKISPPNGSAGAYRMDFPGQKAICFKSASATDVYFGSSTVLTSGFPFFEIGESLCLDLAGGTTFYFYGNGSGGDIRAIFSR